MNSVGQLKSMVFLYAVPHRRFVILTIVVFVLLLSFILLQLSIIIPNSHHAKDVQLHTVDVHLGLTAYFFLRISKHSALRP